MKRIPAFTNDASSTRGRNEKKYHTQSCAVIQSLNNCAGAPLERYRERRITEL